LVTAIIAAAMAWHYISGLAVCRTVGGSATPVARRARLAAGARSELGANYEALAVVLDLGLGQRVEIGDNLGPGAYASERREAAFLSNQREEAEEHMTTDGLVELVEDEPG
jgi:hypothetical protein